MTTKKPVKKRYKPCDLAGCRGTGTLVTEKKTVGRGFIREYGRCPNCYDPMKAGRL